MRRPYNYFKHADRDAHLFYDGPAPDELSDANELITLSNGVGYVKLGGTKTALVNTFSITMAIKRPRLFKTAFLDSRPDLKREFEAAQKNPHFAIPALRHTLCQEGVLPRIG